MKHTRRVLIDGDICRIPLTRGYVAICDRRDAESVGLYNWHACISRGKVYAMRTIRVNGRKKPLPLHRQIAGPGDGVVDHISGNTLDNRRANLRLCSNAENVQRAPYRKTGRSGYVGVHSHGSGLWAVKVGPTHIGYFKDARKAAAAYDVAALRAYGAAARTNGVAA